MRKKTNMPSLAFQKHSQLGEDSWHSILISLLRGLAAFEVAAAHLRAVMYPGLRTIQDPSLAYQALAFFTGFGHQAVLLFFVISGWLVGGSLLNRAGQPDAIANYAIDRMSRLWTVLIPTFALTLLFSLGTGETVWGGIDVSPANEFSAAAFAGNLVGLQGGVAVPEFGGNFPLWSLANETWYYVMFPLLVLMFTARRLVNRTACALSLVALAAFLPHNIVLYFSIWLLGVAFSRLRIEAGLVARCVWLVLLLAVSVYSRLTGTNDDIGPQTYMQDLVCSLMFLVFLSSLQFQAAPASKWQRPLAGIGKFFAEFSFTLYVLHVPLIVLMQHWMTGLYGLRHLSPAAPLHFAIYFGMLALVMLGAYLAYRMFESQTYRIRRLIKDRLSGHGTPLPAGRTAPADS
ncbi:acyltransferase family protein [Massilia sp. TWR1-2-2]|uniref:acyltransferase family protein n=1 Tax=Massilia sp. TWR1-2-2 TaxID=2804584 RepID=UPI003CE87D14